MWPWSSTQEAEEAPLLREFERLNESKWSDTQEAEEVPLLRAQGGQLPRGFKSLSLRHFKSKSLDFLKWKLRLFFIKFATILTQKMFSLWVMMFLHIITIYHNLLYFLARIQGEHFKKAYCLVLNGYKVNAIK